MIRGKVRCPNCGELGHRKTSYKCLLNKAKKRLAFVPHCICIIHVLFTLLTSHEEKAKKKYYQRMAF
jgi:hypothetical protein